MGGPYHAILLQLALAGALSLGFFLGSLALHGARAAADGSVLASRLTARLPGFGAIAVAATAWYAAAEFLEPHHAAAPWLGVALFLAAASWLIGLAARAMLALLAGAILAIFGSVFAPRRPSWSIRRASTPRARSRVCTRRHVARPPPIGFGCRA
jgi:hypothetical protein